jgi:hypothetical protein
MTPTGDVSVVEWDSDLNQSAVAENNFGIAITNTAETRRLFAITHSNFPGAAWACGNNVEEDTFPYGHYRVTVSLETFDVVLCTVHNLDTDETVNAQGICASCTFETMDKIRLYGDATATPDPSEEWWIDFIQISVILRPEVTTGAADRVRVSNARMHGTIVSLGEGSSAQVWFQYGTDAATSGGALLGDPNCECWSETGKITRTSPSSFHITIYGLSNNTTFYFRAAISSGGALDYGDAESFTTNEIPAPLELSLGWIPWLGAFIFLMGLFLYVCFWIKRRRESGGIIK